MQMFCEVFYKLPVFGCINTVGQHCNCALVVFAISTKQAKEPMNKVYRSHELFISFNNWSILQDTTMFTIIDNTITSQM